MKNLRRESMPLPIFYHIDDLRSFYDRTSQGHWFDVSTMQFFGTRLTSHFRQLSDSLYVFVTTEKNPSGQRRASIRLAKVKRSREKFCRITISIQTLGDFHSLSLSQAARKIKTLTKKDI